MKTEILNIITLAVLVVSCASKTAAPTPVVQSEKPKAEAKTAILIAAMDPAENKIVKPEEGKRLYESSCVKCHRLYTPKEFNQGEWSVILPRMQRKANLDDNVMAAISSYIYSEI